MGFQVLPELNIPPISTKDFTEYLRIGDEPQTSVPTLDLSKYLEASTYQSIREAFRYLPRSELGSLIRDKILPMIQAGLQTIKSVNSTTGSWIIVTTDTPAMMKKSFISLFNEVALTELNLRNIDNWTWEQIKMRALYQAKTDATVDQNSLAYKLSATVVIKDPEMAMIDSLNKQYASLPKLGNEGAELNRQAAIVGLMKKKEYSIVQQIINAYKNATPEELALLRQPPPDLSTYVPAFREAMPENSDAMVDNPEFAQVLDQHPVTINSGIEPSEYIPPALYNPLLSLIRRA